MSCPVLEIAEQTPEVTVVTSEDVVRLLNNGLLVEVVDNSAQVSIEDTQDKVMPIPKTGDQVEFTFPGVASVPSTPSGSDVTLTAIAAENIGGQRVVAIVNGMAYLASKDNPAHLNNVVGISTGAAVSGATVIVQHFDEMSEAGWSWTNNRLFVGINGMLTQTRPTSGFAQSVAKVLTSTKIFIDIDEPVVLA